MRSLGLDFFARVILSPRTATALLNRKLRLQVRSSKERLLSLGERCCMAPVRGGESRELI
jgi:hypothetical protein